MENYTDSFGFENHRVTTEEGGYVTIIHYNNEDKYDIGSFHLMNPKGLGFSEYITKRKLEDFTSKINRITWINEEERQFLLSAIQKF